MPNLSEFYARVRPMRERLTEQHPDGFVWLKILPNELNGVPGGHLAQVPVEQAAELLVSGTHVIATDSEIQAFQASQEVVRRRLDERYRRRHLQFFQPVPELSRARSKPQEEK